MFPVYAGVILYILLKVALVMSVPRVCGGDPDYSLLDDIQEGCSPCMRG